MNNQPLDIATNLLVNHVFGLVKGLKCNVPYRAKKWMVMAQCTLEGPDKDYKSAAEHLSTAALICFKSGEEYTKSGVMLLDSSHKIKKEMHQFPRYYPAAEFKEEVMFRPRKKHSLWC